MHFRLILRQSRAPILLRILLPTLTVMWLVACAGEPEQLAADASSNATAAADGTHNDAQGDSGAAPSACGQAQTGKIKLPADDAVHDELVEWWYWTGHLKGENNRRYGFQVTFFIFGAGSFRAQLANVAIVDLKGKIHHSAAKFQFGKAEKTSDGFSFSLGAQTAKGGGGHDVVHAEMAEFTLDLKLDTDRRAVLQHGDGYQTYDFGGYTYYYSRPHMAAKGTLKIGQETTAVSGRGWFDHQWGDLQKATDLGWDWFAISLDDGRDIMAFVVHAKDGDQVVGGSVTDAQCVAKELPAGGFKAGSTGSWTSPESTCVWKIGWNVEVDGMKLKLTAETDAQEMFNKKTPTKSYWEGAVRVEGDATGRAYVELAGCVTAT